MVNEKKKYNLTKVTAKEVEENRSSAYNYLFNMNNEDIITWERKN